MEDKKQPIVIKKIIAGHGHHGGSWKVAFADFATAMMAFFMVLWLVGQTDAQKRGGIAEFFQNPSMVRGHSEAPTGSIGPGGAGLSLISFGSTMEMRKQQDIETVEKIRDGGVAYVSLDKIREQRRLKELLESLKEEIGQSEALTPFKDQLMLEVTPNGLRIQIIDKKNRPMFEPGSANLMHYTEALLREIGKTLNKVPNKISISGHTDASTLARKSGGYSNWELSSDRANAARRAMIDGGMKPDKIARVIGLASTVLFDKENPSSPVNRRISIVVMKRELSDLSKLEEEMKALPVELTQGSLNMENVKDNSPLPSENKNLDIPDNQRMKHIDSSTQTGKMELDLQGLKKESKIESDSGTGTLDFNPRDIRKDSKVKTNSDSLGTMDLELHGLRKESKVEGDGGSNKLQLKLHDTSKDTKLKTNTRSGGMDLKLDMRSGRSGGRARTNTDSGGMDLQFHGLRDKDKKEINSPTKINLPGNNKRREPERLKLDTQGDSNKKDEPDNDPAVEVRSKRSVIKLPTVIDPNLLPNIRRNGSQ